MPNNDEWPKINPFTPLIPYEREPNPYEIRDAITALAQEINLLSGRVDLTLRLLARIIGKMDPAFTQDPVNDPEVRRRSDLLTASVIEKMKQDALAQASSDPESFQRLQRYFKDLP